MDWKRIVNGLLTPPIFVVILLIPTASALLVTVMITSCTDSMLAIFSYTLSAYTLTITGCKVPRAVRGYKVFKNQNRYIQRWRSDPRLRTSISLHLALIFNVSYGALHLGLGLWHGTIWFSSIGAYYVCLAAMRFFLLTHTRYYESGKSIHRELIAYHACGWILLLLNIALSIIIFFMVYWGRSFTHHAITAIAMAAYTFSALALSIANAIRYKKYKSPVFSASRAIGIASALVSMLMLEATMLTTFDDGTLTGIRKKLLLGITGSTISVLIAITAIRMITASTQQLKTLKFEVKNGTKQ